MTFSPVQKTPLSGLQSFIFGQGTEDTYESLQMKRRLAERMAANAGRTPQNIGQGLSAIGAAIAARRMGNKVAAGEKKGREEFNSVFARLLTGQGVPMAPQDGVKTSVSSKSPSGYSDFNAGLARTESGGNYNVTNSEGYAGKYQFGQDRLNDFNRANGTQYTTKDLTAGTPEAARLTEAVQNWHVGDIDAYIKAKGLDRYIGQTVGGAPITLNGLRAMAHLGGKGGMEKFVTSGGKYNPADSNGTSLADYAKTHAGGGNVRVSTQGPYGGVEAASAGGINPALVEALSNPYATEGQKAVLSALLQQRIAASQPMSPLERLQIEKAQIDLDRARNPATEYRIEELADGRKYYVDPTGREPARLVNPDGQPGKEVDFDTEQKLRKEFQGLPTVKDFSDINDAWDRIQAAGTDPSGAGDLALIFNFMKLLDPGSTVREGEFANAENAGGIPSRIANIYNRITQGERLSPEQRADFLDRAGKLFNAQAGNYNDAATRYRGLAEAYKVSPERIAELVDLYQVSPEQAAAAAAETPENNAARDIAGSDSANMDLSGDDQEKAAFFASPKVQEVAKKYGLTVEELWDARQ